ncbi:MAG: steroid 5-alpha reductase family enzyme [Limisphaerales bacterium]|jgi:steroid 5-alpha reductase family enzyme
MSFVLLSLLIITALNLAGFAFGYFAQSDKATDILYSLSFVIATAVMVWMCGKTNGQMTTVQWIGAGMVFIWAFRLGSYLFTRIHKIGKDDRFDDMRPSPIRLFGFWFIQIVTVWIVLFPISALLEKPSQQEWLTPIQIIALAVWLIGLVMETVADRQKFDFRNDSKNKGQFMNEGLWKSIRHPNYTGEILCWWAVFAFCLPALGVAGIWTILSPLWLTLMLVFVSGIPLLEKSAEKRYGHLEAYQQWLKTSKRLFPGIW